LAAPQAATTSRPGNIGKVVKLGPAPTTVRVGTGLGLLPRVRRIRDPTFPALLCNFPAELSALQRLRSPGSSSPSPATAFSRAPRAQPPRPRRPLDRGHGFPGRGVTWPASLLQSSLSTYPHRRPTPGNQRHRQRHHQPSAPPRPVLRADHACNGHSRGKPPAAETWPSWLLARPMPAIVRCKNSALHPHRNPETRKSKSRKEAEVRDADLDNGCSSGALTGCKVARAHLALALLMIHYRPILQRQVRLARMPRRFGPALLARASLFPSVTATYVTADYFRTTDGPADTHPGPAATFIMQPALLSPA
jgi:hypothetical protein